MKRFTKFTALLAACYALLWVGVAIYFSVAERHKELLELHLSSVFDRKVTIQKVTTGWKGAAPVVQFDNFKVAGDTEAVPALAFKQLSAEFTPLSFLRLWPKIKDMAVEQPVLEVVSLTDNRLQIAGIVLQENQNNLGLNRERLFSWLLNHKSAAWHNGKVIWRKPNNVEQVYDNISIVYQREKQQRNFSATTLTPKGTFAIKATTNGDILQKTGWDAALEVIGNDDQQLLDKNDVSMKVVDGRGQLQLKKLDIEHIRDTVLILGLSSNANWILNSAVSGVLSDVVFEFSGSLLDVKDWSLVAAASDVKFEEYAQLPGMSNLAGDVDISAKKGRFAFNAADTEFAWAGKFKNNIVIDQSSGTLKWEINQNGKVDLYAENLNFDGEAIKVWNLNAHTEIGVKKQKIDEVSDLFKLRSIGDLTFENVPNQTTQQPAETSLVATEKAPISLSADAKFEVESFPKLVKLLPEDPKLKNFRSWWSNAFLSGQASNGTISYRGKLSKAALESGEASLVGRAEYENVDIDYGYQDQWPVLRKSSGIGTLNNSLLTITPEKAWLEDDELTDSELTIRDLFDDDRHLDVKGSVVTSLPTMMRFLFNGPLMPADQRDSELPIKPVSGKVSGTVAVSIPLNEIKNATVQGTGKVINGSVLLPEKVPVTKLNGNVVFTEQTIKSDNIRANFMGGKLSGKLVTVKPAKPPVVKLIAQGEADVAKLEPWVGKHLLSWMSGRAQWQGSVKVDGETVSIDSTSNLKGITVDAPEPIKKSAQQQRDLKFSMQVGGSATQTKMSINYGSVMRGQFQGDLKKGNSLFDKSIIQIDENVSANRLPMLDGVNYQIDYDDINLDEWLTAIIDLATLPTDDTNTDFLDAMRTLKINASNPYFLGRVFGPLQASAVSTDGGLWVGSIKGQNMNGTMQMEPRADKPYYRFNLSDFNLVEQKGEVAPLEPIDHSLQAADYPEIEFNVDEFVVSQMRFGKLNLLGRTIGNRWQLENTTLQDRGITSTITGGWSNTKKEGTISSFDIKTKIDEAGDVLEEMQFNDLIRKGSGELTANLNWIGAPHEFDFSRLNGNFDLQVKDGELVQVDSAAGKLLGLLNFNSIARRLTLDFRDVFSEGLKFDRMHYSGILADGKAMLRDANMMSPAAFVTMHGNIDLAKELIDMEIHASPDLGGNLTLLSAIANPTAGAVVFVAQQIFKDKMRSANFQSYRALGTWEEFELEEFNASKQNRKDQREADKQRQQNAEKQAEG